MTIVLAYTLRVSHHVGLSGVEVKALGLNRKICDPGPAPLLFSGSVDSILGGDGVGRKELGLPPPPTPPTPS